MPWNIRPLVIAAVLMRAADTANAFFVPTALINNARSHVLRSTPDQWLGSSPSDHYGGAVGPMFERFDGGGEAADAEDTKSYTANIAPLDWNGGTMEAGFTQQQVHVQSGKSFYPANQEGNREVEPVVNQEGEEDESNKSINWDDGSIRQVIFEQQKWIPSGHYDQAFESQSIPQQREYSTLKQVTPAGQPKMIQPEGTTQKKKKVEADPVPEDLAQELQGTLSPYELWTKNGEQRKPPAEGFPISEFRSIPDQPGEWFYHDVSSEKPRTSWQGVRPEQKKKSESFQDNGSMERGLGHDEKYEKETRRKREQKLIQESPNAKLLQATPPGQPKLIRPDGPAAPTAAKKKKNGKEEKEAKKIAASVGTMLDQEQEKSEGEQRLPPAEGFPISGFRSTPDQPWFYHDVSTEQQQRPDWPNLRQAQKQKVYSFQDGGSMESGLGHEPKESP